MKFTLAHIEKTVGGKLVGDPNLVIHEIQIDSRKYMAPGSSLFIAIKGERNDGHRYIPDLAEKGIDSFLVEKIPDGANENLNFIVVEDSLQAMHLLAASVRQQYHGKIIGITGSNGKTILKEWIHQSLSKYKKVYRSPESYNSQVGVPLSFFLLDEDSDIAVIEAGISKTGEMEKLVAIVSPETGILTNIGEAHQENFSSLEEKLEEKLLLFRNSEKVIYCRNNPLISAAMDKVGRNSGKVGWGTVADSDYIIRSTGNQDEPGLEINGRRMARFRIGFQDKASAENISHLIVLLFEEGYDNEFIQEAIDNLEPVAMRMEIIAGAGNASIINDCYNSDLNSIKNAFDYLANQDKKKKKTVILSDIIQSGKKADEWISAINTMVEQRNPGRIIGIGEKLFHSAHRLPGQWKIYRTSDDFIREINKYDFSNETILLKGARQFEFERIAALLQEKTHRTIMEIDLNAVVGNYRFYKSLLPGGTRVMAMVKAFSYGSGGSEVADVLQYNKVDYLAVAYADEGVQLRQKGIHLPIMVMNPEKQDFHIITSYNLEPEIFNARILREFRSYLSRNASREWPVHIKLDTGMNRLGFREDEADILKSEIQMGGIRIASVFSHLAAADEKEQDDFTLHQIEVFKRLALEIEKLVSYPVLKHILNTPGIERFPQAAFDMVRLGIGLYGVSEKYSENLTEVSRFKTMITQVREINESDTVGYGRRGRVRGKAVIGTLPVGYADGIPRSLGNGRGKFLTGGKIVPVIGNVCMDMTMVDLTGTGAGEGDEVIIFGPEYTVKNLALSMNTISYEVLTGISQRVKRVYFIE